MFTVSLCAYKVRSFLTLFLNFLHSHCSESTMSYCGVINVKEHCVDGMVDSQPRMHLSQQTIMTDASVRPTGHKRDNIALDKFT